MAERTREDLASEVVDLRRELREAHSEINRHHLDFKRVQEVVDMMDSCSDTESTSTHRCLMAQAVYGWSVRLRNIVG